MNAAELPRYCAWEPEREAGRSGHDGAAATQSAEQTIVADLLVNGFPVIYHGCFLASSDAILFFHCMHGSFLL